MTSYSDPKHDVRYSVQMHDIIIPFLIYRITSLNLQGTEKYASINERRPIKKGPPKKAYQREVNDSMLF